jgi:hypothetical protein
LRFTAIIFARSEITEHALLKKNQIRSNSFYKLFPEEIYRDELIKLKERIMGAFKGKPLEGRTYLEQKYQWTNKHE